MTAANSPKVEFTFNGQPLQAKEGQSIAAGLMSNGILAWRLTRKSAQPRGVFCGIGVCFDCLVKVDGLTNQRACLIQITEGMDVVGETTDEGPAR